MTEEERMLLRRVGSLGGLKAAANLTARQRRERSMKAAHSLKAKAWRAKLQRLAREHAEQGKQEVTS